MQTCRWILGGLIGGAIGVAIWVLIGYFTHYEVGWIAWGVGFLAGFGICYSAHLAGGDASVIKGVAAALIACGSIVLAKLHGIHLDGRRNGRRSAPCRRTHPHRRRRRDRSDSFAPWDILWFLLAIVTAFKVGAGTYGDD